MVDISGEICYALNNQVGSIEALYGADSATAAQARAEYIYSSYGEIMMKSGDLADKNNITYSTRYKEANTGLVSYTYRHYSPRLKKWINKDPIAEQGGVNLYQIVDNQPIENWDGFGEGIRSFFSRIYNKIFTVDPREVYKICDGYDKFKSNCCRDCCDEGQTPVEERDEYPINAKPMCYAFADKYAKALNAKRMKCVASCLISTENGIHKLKTCDKRNAARLGAHFKCYAKCKFIPYLWFPYGALDFGFNNLLMPTFREPITFIENLL